MKWVADKKKRGGGKGEGGRKSKKGRRKTWEVMRGKEAVEGGREG